jgi:hypothetical protein
VKDNFPGHFQISDGFEEELNNCGQGMSAAPVQLPIEAKKARSFVFGERDFLTPAPLRLLASVVTDPSTRFAPWIADRAKARLRSGLQIVDKNRRRIAHWTPQNPPDGVARRSLARLRKKDWHIHLRNIAGELAPIRLAPFSYFCTC